MVGVSELLRNNKYESYICDCGVTTEYGIYRYISDDEWLIDSCCGGCVSAVNIKYCPFCGQKIEIRR